MSTASLLTTTNLKLVLQSLEEVRASIEGMSPSERAEVSPDWLARVQAATAPDPWIHGFALVHRASDAVVGNVGYKGPPTTEGVVEIAYGVHPDHQGKGYATEAAEALTAYAFSHGDVRMVRAHTLPETNASTRVLTKVESLRQQTGFTGTARVVIDVDEKTSQMSFLLVDKDNGDVLHKIPEAEFLPLLRDLVDRGGLMVDRQL